VKILRSCALTLLVLLVVAGGCTRQPITRQTELKVKTIPELQSYLQTHKPDLELFMLRGPFAVTADTDRELRLSASERINTDLYLSAPAEKAPLVIFLHGYDSSKEAHANQAMHVATWGIHCLTLQLPKTGAWTSNGKTLGRVVNLIYRSPEVLDSRIDRNKIILVGHSFGASSVAIALGDGVPAAGGVLLDPAAIGRDLPKFLQQIRKPVIVLGADERVAWARNRNYFFEFIRGSVAEVSIRGATHEDAQYPSEYAVKNGADPHTTEELQVTFAGALTAAVVSLASTGTVDYAWTSFSPVLESGKFYNARRK
jgi:pimeloyl-ACP methyl ester carboxylesterase